jgi:chromosome segregation protein
VFLKSLTLKGFKSFADTTTLEFEPGVTVVVGPNGSGKSNVVDAVAWVLGAQGPRTVRSARMEDVIFAGTPRRAPLGRAEVSLTIDNSSGLLPIEFSEVTITRTLFRTGESEYAINRVPCRLLDVQELLSDTGVGRQQHVIVSQGNLDAVLSSRPEDRRMVIEEAAGVLKYRRRKERAERRLEATEASLQRLGDLLREVRRQLKPLEKQADAARRHDGLVAELTALRRHLAGRELAAIEARIRAVADRSGALDEEERRRRSELANLDAEVAASEAQLATQRARTDELDLAEAVTRAEGLRARAGGLAALLEQRRRTARRELAAVADQDVIASLDAEAAGLREQLAAVETEAGGLLAHEAEVATAERALAAEAAEVEARWREGTDRPADPAAEVRGELSARRTALDRVRGELRRAESRRDAAVARLARAEAEAARLGASLAAADEEAPALAAAAEAAAVVLDRAEAAHAAAAARAASADAARHRSQARHEALAAALDDARARAGAEHLAGSDGVLGALVELVDVDPGWEAAFEAAAGEALVAVVVDGDGAAAALRLLRGHETGGAVAVAAELSGPPRAVPAADVPAGAVPVRSHVRSEQPALRALLDRLLGSAVCAPGFDEAVALAVSRSDLVVVTPEGDRFADGVWRTGAGGSGVTGALVEDAAAAAAEAGRLAGEAAADLDSARAALDAARREAVSAERAAEAVAARRRSLADAVARARREVEDAAGDAQAADAQQGEAAERLAAEAARVDQLAAALPHLEAEAALQAERVRVERAERERLAERATAVAALRRDLEVRAVGLEERRALLQGRLSSVEERLARNVAERELAAARRERLVADVTALDRLVETVAPREAGLAEIVERLREARRLRTDADRAATERLDGLRRRRAEREQRLGELREQRARTEIESGEARVRLEALTDLVRRELDCEPETTRDAPCPPLPPGTSPSSRRAELERELRLMGPVNPLALEEFTALQERHAFLEGQLEDVRAARRELGKVIRAVDAEIVEVLRAAFADVSDNFERLFATLFPGGQGRLRLTDPDHLLDTGIELEARPSGKNVRRLSLLSGGERSLTAMAFLFAVFRSRPSPFYLMDEVEAALDDVNLHRFLDLVHEFRDEAQLVIVSHQKRTMEAADCLYGVTMPPGGSSQVVAERVRVATPA